MLYLELCKLLKMLILANIIIKDMVYVLMKVKNLLTYEKEEDQTIEDLTTEDQIKDEKLQYDINREAAKISALSSGKIDKYEYLTGEEILPSNQQQIIEQAKFTYSPLGKAFEKQTKTIKDQGIKQVKAIQDNKQLVNINNDDDYKNKPLLSKERQIFQDIYNK